MRYTIQQIAEITGGSFLAPPTEAVVEHLLLDSRQVIFPASSLFVALQGRRFNGHEFIQELYDSGVRNFLISKNLPSALGFPLANFILVKNTQEAFHALAAWHRRQFSLPIIGITGSNGKTIVKEWLFQLLYEDHHVVRSPKSFNSQTGVPLSVLQITSEHTLGIFEAGISKPGEMEKLGQIIAPDIGIFTNIGEAHQEGFPMPQSVGMKTKVQEKLLLFNTCRTIIYSVDNELVANEMNAAFGETDKRLITWSAYGKPADLRVLNHHFSNGKTKISAAYDEPDSSESHFVEIEIPFTDAASIENATHCWALLLHLGLPEEVISARMARLEPVAMRLELKEGVNGCTVINDSYNSDLTSLGIALNFLEQQGKTLRRTLVLSDILQSGQSVAQLYGTVAGLLVEKRIDRLIGIGKKVEHVKKYLPTGFDVQFYPSTQALLDDFQHLVFRDEVILLKGARQYEFERLANRLAIKFHKTVLEVNLGALLNNLRVYQSQLGPGTKIMVMVKAGAYGSGSTEVAKLLEFQNVDYLGVAYADEGVELRKAGIQLPILVMNPEEATFEALVRYRLEPEVYSLGLLRNFLAFLENHFAQKNSMTANGEVAKTPTPQPIHLKLDTGMHRLGFEEKDLDGLLPVLNAGVGQPVFVVKTVFSHLAASEAPQHDGFTAEQFARFQKMYEILAAGLGYRPMRHILNSGGIVRFPEQQMEMVRLGIGLYGVDSSGLLQDRLQTVNTLKATISQIKNVEVGETVGYGRLGKALRPMRIATLSLGYADGLLRRAGNGQFSVLINEKRAPLIGNVCMDMTMADVTDIPDAAEGGQAVIFGKDLPVQELANSLGTIPYEIFTTISERVKRVYVQE